ncbi:hypothetical protein EG329_002606 [Mollisiaceae sp. DMI_Dod_QoI]|nr:hypothetical protein EG329_002606 [Helotiales sp. DMI_Dod_QoI]
MRTPSPSSIITEPQPHQLAFSPHFLLPEVALKLMMGTPLDLAAGAVGFASIGVLFMQGCVKGFILLSTAQNFGQDADLIRCEIEFEQFRLFRWADKVGLDSDSPNRNLNWAIINDVLKQLQALMNDTAKFKTEYGLEVVTMEEHLSSDDLEVPKTGLRRLIARIKPEFHNETARRLQKESKVWKRLKWSAIDKVGIEMLVNDIRRKIDKLYDLLQEDDQRFIRNGIEALLRHAVSQANAASDLSTIEQLLHPEAISRSKFEESAIKTALSLKQRSMLLDIGGPRQPGSSRSSTSTLVASNSSNSTRSATQSTFSGSKRKQAAKAPLSSTLLERTAHSKQEVQSREMALYDSSPVFIEWKTVERGLESKLKHRIKSLAALLQEMDGSTFHSLSCIGYLRDQETGNYGYVFRPPAKDLQPFTALAHILGGETSSPNLNDRFALAIALAETVLQLHTSGWLHKGIRSDNILFFPDSKESVDLTQAFLGGYEYARADNPSDMTESPAMQQESNLYRHPALLKANRASFRKAFDLFSLGCVLVEIGLWATLTTTLLHVLRSQKATDKGMLARMPTSPLTYLGKAEVAEVNKDKFGLLTANGKGSIGEALEFATGKTFASVVSLCLTTGNEKEAPEDDDDEDDQCIDLELDILEKLRSCRI